MDAIGLDVRLRPHPNLFLREEGDDGALLYDPDSGAVRLMNPAAVAVWKLLDGRRTLREVLAALAESFSGMGPDAAGEVLELARSLHQAGLLGVAGEEEP